VKKYLAISLAVVALATAGAAQTSGTLTIQGSVAPSVNITVATVSGYNALNIAAGVSAQNVANITEKCNVKAGYTVRMTSLNATTGNSLFLADTAGGTGNDTVPYTLAYNGTAVSFINGSALLTDITGKTTSAGVTKALAVTITAAWVNAATYADTLTFTIANK
jgi:hypothetical protein